jgi:transposase
MSAAADTAQVQIPLVTGGVDTHQLTHHAALLDSELNQIADREFAATSTGYQELVDWMAGYGRIAVVGVESTGSYGAGLTRHLLAAGIEVVEGACQEFCVRGRSTFTGGARSGRGRPGRVGRVLSSSWW